MLVALKQLVAQENTWPSSRFKHLPCAKVPESEPVEDVLGEEAVDHPDVFVFLQCKVLRKE